MNSERYLHDIYDALKGEVRSGHALLEQFERSIPERLFLAELVVAITGGSCENREVKVIAVSLELMRLGTELHYGNETSATNLSLIAADYYYARAISQASALPNVPAVSALSKAIAEIAAAEVGTESGEAPFGAVGLRAGLFAAAGELGGRLAGFESGRIDDLAVFGRSAGAIHFAAAGWGSPNVAEKLSEDAAKREAASILNKLDDPSLTLVLDRYLKSMPGEGQVL